MTEKEKAISGETYNPSDKELFKTIMKMRKIVKEFNAIEPDNFEELMRYRELLFDKCGDNVIITQPFRITFGCNTRLGSNVFINSNCSFLDGSYITVGDRVLFGPDVKLYGGFHPLEGEKRWVKDENEKMYIASNALPITIGNDVWIGGNATILPGITVGNNSTIGASSVVTKDVPPYSVVAGNPAKIIRFIERNNLEKNFLDYGFKKIIIIGCPGAGKSTMAKELSSMLKINAVYLDKLYWKPNWIGVDNDTFDKLLADELNKDTWIIEGNFERTMKLRMDRADLVIYLDYDTKTCLDSYYSRIENNGIKEFITEGCVAFLDEEFVQVIKDFNSKSRDKTYQMIKESNKPYIIFSSRPEKEAFMTKLKASIKK